MLTKRSSAKTVLQNNKSEDNFKLDLGMSSFDTMCMVAEIESTMGVKLTAADFIKYKTVGEMAKYIATLV